MTESPVTKYQHLIKSGAYQIDSNQAKVIHELDRIYYALKPRLKKRAIWSWLRNNPEPIVGLYLWGGVGIGKTWLMDIFCECLPSGAFLRIHFHHFMQQVHDHLKQLQGKQDPLAIIARSFAKERAILCFDEFFVSDIADAMLLSNLLEALFQSGVGLVTTSNITPDLLYKGGINREQFLPAIKLIKKYTNVFHLTNHKDYRFSKLEQANMYYYPLNSLTSKKLLQHFKIATDNRYCEDEVIEVYGHELISVALGRGVAWFDFDVLCKVPRSQVDYLEIAKLFHTVFLSNVPKIPAGKTNSVLYLINLVDILYDAKVKFVLSAECSINHLYEKGELITEFARTRSRLEEMQSIHYIQQPHSAHML